MIYSPKELGELDAFDIAQMEQRAIMQVIQDLIETGLAYEARFESLHQHINHLRSVIYPPKMSDSAAWRAVPVKHLSAIQNLMDPPPMRIGGKTIVFMNPHAAEILTRINAEIRAMLEATPPLPPEVE